MPEFFDPSNPPQGVETVPVRTLRQREKSAVREAITAVCETAMGERGSKLKDLLDKIEAQDGPKAAFDALVKLLEFTTPKLQRVTVEDPDGEAPKVPIINVTFGQPIKVVNPDGD